MNAIGRICEPLLGESGSREYKNCNQGAGSKFFVSKKAADSKLLAKNGGHFQLKRPMIVSNNSWCQSMPTSLVDTLIGVIP